MRLVRLFGENDLGGHLALVARDELTVASDHVADGKQPAVRGQHLEEVRGDTRNAGLVEYGGERLELLVSSEDGATHHPEQIGALVQQRAKAVEIGPDRIGGMLFEREFE